MPPSVWVTKPFHLLFSVAGHVFSQQCLWESPLDKELKIYRSVNAEALSTCLYAVNYSSELQTHGLWWVFFKCVIWFCNSSPQGLLQPSFCESFCWIEALWVSNLVDYHLVSLRLFFLFVFYFSLQKKIGPNVYQVPFVNLEWLIKHQFPLANSEFCSTIDND